MAREHTAKKIFCYVKQMMQKPFQAWICSNEDISSPISFNLPKQSYKPHQVRENGLIWPKRLFRLTYQVAHDVNPSHSLGNTT